VVACLWVRLPASSVRSQPAISVIRFFGGLFTKAPLVSGLPVFCVKPTKGGGGYFRYFFAADTRTVLRAKSALSRGVFGILFSVLAEGIDSVAVRCGRRHDRAG
jgi:hypothetical protein